MRKRLEGTLPKDHEDHIAGKGFNTLSPYNIVHKVVPFASSDENSGCESSSGHSMGEFRTVASSATAVKNKKQVLLEAQKETRMDICHLKYAELDSKLQKYQGRVVLRGDTVKDDSGVCAVFIEQGSSASQMTTAKAMDDNARPLDCDGKQLTLYPHALKSKWRTLRHFSTFRSQDVQMYGYVSTTQVAKVMVEHWRPCGSFWAKFVRSPTCWLLVGKTVRGSSIGTWKSTELGMSFCSSETRIVLNGFRGGWHQNVWKESRTWVLCRTNWWNWSILENQHHFLTTHTWDVLNVNANRSMCHWGIQKDVRITIFCGEQQFSVCEEPHAKTVAWSCDVEGHAKKCVEQYCEVANMKTEQLCKGSTPCLDDHNLKKEELETVGEWSKVCSQIVLKNEFMLPEL